MERLAGKDRLVIKTVVVWIALIYLVCAAAYIVLPNDTFDFLWRPILHSFDIRPVGIYMVVGFAETVAYAALATWLFIKVREYVAKKKGLSKYF